MSVANEYRDGETLAFLAERLNGNAGDNGISSDAMISAAVLGRVPAKSDFPSDWSDLGRCCQAFDRAPYRMKPRLLPILELYIAHIKAKYEVRREVVPEPVDTAGVGVEKETKE